MALLTVKRNLPVYATLRSSDNTGTAAASKVFNFANAIITNNGISVISPSSIRVPDAGAYEFNITLGASHSVSFTCKFQYGINGVWTDIVSTSAGTTHQDRFSLIIDLDGYDLVEFRAVALTGAITSTYCGNFAGTTSLKDTTSIKRVR